MASTKKPEEPKKIVEDEKPGLEETKKNLLDILHMHDRSAKQRLQELHDQEELNRLGGIQTDIRAENLKFGKAFHEAAEEELKLETERLQQEGKRPGIIRELTALLRKQAELRAQEYRDLQRTALAEDSLVAKTKDILKLTTGVSAAWKDTAVGSFFNAKSVLGFSGALKQVTKGWKETMTGANIMGSTLMKVQETTAKMVFALDDSAASLGKATGTGRQFEKQLYNTQFAFSAMGVGLGETSAAFNSLYTNFNQFSELGTETQNKMSGWVAGLENMGISSSTSAKNINILTTALGMGGEQALKTQTQMAGFAKSIGVAASKMAEDFSQAMTTLAAQGDNAVRIFKDMEIQAKKTGLGMSELVGIAAKFDTFNEAAEITGRLNSILGGNYLDALSMVNMKENERIDLLKGIVQQSGRSWLALNKQERQALASAAGISDMVQAARLFGGTAAVFEMLEGKAKKLGMGVKDLEQTMREGKSAREKFTLMMSKLAIAVKPLVTMINGLINLYMRLDKWTMSLTNNTFGLSHVLGGILLIWGLVKLAVAGYALSQMGANTAAAASSIPFAASAYGLKMLGAAAVVAKPGLIVLGIAVAVITAAVVLMAGAMAVMFAQMSGAGPAFTAMASAMASLVNVPITKLWALKGVMEVAVTPVTTNVAATATQKIVEAVSLMTSQEHKVDVKVTFKADSRSSEFIKAVKYATTQNTRASRAKQQ